ncbi:hypothetical protein J7E99_35280 [Streptomyces sp. ISL-44]|uniref:hypothetical protein n=1 Tax=Streptomyces sp. ISL-44 TaxID=2819184 RepID=UPI001BEAA7D6|nr:hypothetical protein [Streptomyces sp. ISL-44]MBT2545796.1 hypothetical protein [Streptomyces sp. ISL-44]
MTVAVGWVGIEIAQLILGLVGLTTDDAGVVRATRVVMEILGIELIAGIAWTALLTGGPSPVKVGTRVLITRRA